MLLFLTPVRLGARPFKGLVAGGLALSLSACAASLPSSEARPATVHEARFPGAGLYQACTAPNGQWVEKPWVSHEELYSMKGECAAPNRYIVLPICVAEQTPPQETPAALRAKVDLAQDQSLVGDEFEGKPFCIMPPPF